MYLYEDKKDHSGNYIAVLYAFVYRCGHANISKHLNRIMIIISFFVNRSINPRSEAEDYIRLE